MGIGTGLVGPVPAAYVADLSHSGQHGLTTGLYKTFGDVGVTAGPLLMGWLSDLAGHALAFQVNAALFAAAGLALGLLARETAGRQAPRPQA